MTRLFRGAIVASCLVPADALAHGSGFGLSKLSSPPGALDEIWALVTGIGVAWTEDGGASWSWACAAAVGGDQVYDVVAVAPGTAVVATDEGLFRFEGATETSSPVGGLPEGTEARVLTSQPDGTLFVGTIDRDEGGGVWRCPVDGDCEQTDLFGEDLFPRAIVPANHGVWVSAVRLGDGPPGVWWSSDGRTFEQRVDWTIPDSVPIVLGVVDDRLFVWEEPHSAAVDPAIRVLSAEDATGIDRFVFPGGWVSPTGALAVLRGGDLLLTGDGIGGTWASEDRGDTWTDRTADLPEVTCSAQVADRTMLCTDHANDGFDLAWTAGDAASVLTPVCLTSANTTAVGLGVCWQQTGTWNDAIALGGGTCGASIPLDPDPPGSGEDGCRGCDASPVGGAGLAARAAALVTWVSVLVLSRRRR